MRTTLVAVALLLALGDALAADAATTVACEASAYVGDPDPRGLNVRAGPGSRHRALAQLHNGDLVQLSGAQGEWIRIARAESEGPDGDYQAVFSGEGWVHGPLLAVGAAWNEDGYTPVHAQPRADSPLLRRLQYDAIGEAQLRGCQGRWLLLEYRGAKPLRGWVDSGKVCVNQRTECS